MSKVFAPLLGGLTRIGSLIFKFGRSLITWPKALDDSLHKLSPAVIFWSSIFVNVGLGLLAATAIFLPAREARFSADVLTESLSVDIPAGGRLPEQLMRGGAAGEATCGPGLVSVYQPTAGLRVEMTFVGKKAYVLVRSLDKLKRPFAITLPCDGEGTEISTSFRPRSFDASGFDRSFTVEGLLTLGQVPADGQPALLKAGEVTSSTSSFPLKSARVTETSKIMLGDRVRFFDRPQGRGEREATTAAVIRFDAKEAAFHVVAHTTAERVEVSRLGADTSFPISVAPTLWSRLRAQSEWALIAVLLAITINILGVLRYYLDSKRAKVEGKNE